MDINTYILKINKLRNETVARRAIITCKELLQIAKDRSIDITILTAVYKEMLDNGMVNKVKLDMYKQVVSTQWFNVRQVGAKTVSLTDNILISKGNDLNLVNISKYPKS